MVTIKRSLLFIVGLLCVLGITACGGTANATNAASQGNANSTVATIAAPTATPQPTANPIKVQVQQDQKTTQPQVKAQAANNANQTVAQSNSNTNTNTTKNTQSMQAQNNTQSTQNTNNGNSNNNNMGGSLTVVASTQLNVNGQMMNVLTTGTGLTLYYRTSDPAPDSTCTGACAQTWPPLLAQGNVVPASNIQGSLTVHTTANGSQVEYNNRPLYTYSGDTTHEVNGQGVNGVWNAVTVLAQKQHW